MRRCLHSSDDTEEERNKVRGHWVSIQFFLMKEYARYNLLSYSVALLRSFTYQLELSVSSSVTWERKEKRTSSTKSFLSSVFVSLPLNLDLLIHLFLRIYLKH